jgi:hypothetical protein
MTTRRRAPGAIVAALLGLSGGVAVGTIGAHFSMPFIVVWLGLFPLMVAAMWLVLAVLWRRGWIG